MVSSVSGNINPSWKGSADSIEAQYAINGLKTATAIQAEEKSDSFALSAGIAVGSTALFEGIPYALYHRRNKKINGEMTPEMRKLDKATQEAFQNIYKGNNGSFFERVGKYFQVINHNFEAYSDVKSITKAKANLKELEKDKFEKSAKAITNPGKINEWRAERAEKSFNKAQKTAAKKVTPVTIAEKFDPKKTIKTIMKTSGVGITLALGGIIEGILEVYPTFKELGTEKGMKQLGKSAVKVACDTAAFTIGFEGGMALGAGIGSMICPGLGTVIGGFAGMLTGCLSTSVSSKLTEKIVGKSEREIAKELQEKQPPQDYTFSIAA